MFVWIFSYQKLFWVVITTGLYLASFVFLWHEKSCLATCVCNLVCGFTISFFKKTFFLLHGLSATSFIWLLVYCFGVCCITLFVQCIKCYVQTRHHSKNAIPETANSKQVALVIVHWVFGTMQWFTWVTTEQWLPNAQFPMPKETFICISYIKYFILQYSNLSLNLPSDGGC